MVIKRLATKVVKKAISHLCPKHCLWNIDTKREYAKRKKTCGTVQLIKSQEIAFFQILGSTKFYDTI